MQATGHPSHQSRFVRLADGRSLCYVDVGPPAAPPVMHFHVTCPPDLAALGRARPEIASASFMTESIRRGLDGPARDAWILTGPWGFEPEEVTPEVHLWHGGVDPTVPLRHSHELASLLPRARLHVCPGEGHLLYAAHLDEIMQAATGRTPATPRDSGGGPE